MIIEAFKNEDPSALQAGGIKLGQNKYMFLRVNGDSFYGKQGVSKQEAGIRSTRHMPRFAFPPISRDRQAR